MTLPNERYRSIKYARDFLRSLLDRKATPRVPLVIRQQARNVLKHYPSQLDMRCAATHFDKVFEMEKEGEE